MGWVRHASAPSGVLTAPHPNPAHLPARLRQPKLATLSTSSPLHPHLYPPTHCLLSTHLGALLAEPPGPALCVDGGSLVVPRADAVLLQQQGADSRTLAAQPLHLMKARCKDGRPAVAPGGRCWLPFRQRFSSQLVWGTQRGVCGRGLAPSAAAQQLTLWNVDGRSASHPGTRHCGGSPVLRRRLAPREGNSRAAAWAAPVAACAGEVPTPAGAAAVMGTSGSDLTAEFMPAQDEIQPGGGCGGKRGALQLQLWQVALPPLP